MTRVLGITMAFAALFARAAVAQDDRWQVTLDGERYVWDIRLLRLERDALVVRQSDSLARVPVAHITEIRLIQKSEAEARGGGAMAGAMSALVGGDDEVYDLATLDLPARRRAIQKILALHPSGP